MRMQSYAKSSFTILLGHFIESLFSPLATEVWELESGNNKLIQPTLPDDDYGFGIALVVVDKDFCKNNSPPKTCFKINTDPGVPNSLGDEIKLFKNGGEIGVALGSNQISNEICIDETSVADVFEFKNGGSDNVSTS